MLRVGVKYVGVKVFFFSSEVCINQYYEVVWMFSGRIMTRSKPSNYEVKYDLLSHLLADEDIM